MKLHRLLAFLAAACLCCPVAAQETERVSLNAMTRLDSGPEGSFAFTCMVEVDQPANSQLTVRLVQISDGKTATARASAFSWRASDAADSAKGQIVLFGQSGSEIGKGGSHYLTLLAGFEGNPVQRGEGAGPLAVESTGGWWSRYGRPEAAPGQPMILFLMGSGEATEGATLAELQEQSKKRQQRFVAVTLELSPLK
jgi:hypothetical protein